MRVLVTGGTGFIGSNLALRLKERGDDVFITGAPGEQNPPVAPDRRFPLDVAQLDWDTLEPLDLVFHLAAINDTTLLDRAAMIRANVEASQRLFADAVRHGCQRMVYASSTAVYGDVPAPYREDGPVHPLNPYAESKLLLDEFARAFVRAHPDVVVVGLRYCNVYGPGEAHKEKRASMIFQLAQQMVRGNPRLFQYGEQRRDYLFVGDAVQANLLAASARESRLVNCGSGVATSFNDLVAVLNEVLGTRRVPEYMENPYADRYQSHTECDMTLAGSAIGFFSAVDIRTGIRRYAESGELVPLPLRAGQTSATLPSVKV